MIAYEITNTITGRRYIGITSKGVDARLKQHFRYAAGGKSMAIIHQSIRKHGVSAFTIREIASALSWSDLQRVECDLIVQEGTMQPAGYNLMPGGDGGPTMLGRKLTKTQSANLSVAKLKTWASYTPERRAEIGSNISLGKAGKGTGPRGPYKSRGVPKSPSHRDKLAELNRQRAKSPDFAATISHGLTHSEAFAAYNSRRGPRGPYKQQKA